MITINVGTQLPDGVAHLTAQDVASAIRGSFPGALRGWVVAQSNTEPTVVARLDIDAGAGNYFAFIGKVYRLAGLLDQDCIAVSGHDTTAGELIGPNAADWGDFNPAFFITYEEAVMPETNDKLTYGPEREDGSKEVFDGDRCIGRLMPEIDPATLITAYRPE